ncbi:hypothetical protein FKP32DRAFT_1545651, partial [Trametes sanguinea]
GRRQRPRSPSELSYAGESDEQPRNRPRIASMSRPRNVVPPSDVQHSDDDDSVPGPTEAKRIAQRIKPAGSRPRMSDFEPDAQEITKLAAVYYKGRGAAEDAYPSKLTENTWAREAWYRASHKLDIELAPNSELIQVLTHYSWNLRGEIKTAARSSVPGVYKFKPIVTHDARIHNHNQAAHLRKARTFAYKDIGQHEEDHDGLYENDIIQMVVNQVFYKDAEDDGILLSTVYDPFPTRAVALVLTAIQCAIDEWSTGVHTNVKFTEDAYSNIYKDHLQDLQDFEAASGEDRILLQMRKEISQYGRYVAIPPPL